MESAANSDSNNMQDKCVALPDENDPAGEERQQVSKQGSKQVSREASIDYQTLSHESGTKHTVATSPSDSVLCLVRMGADSL